MATPNFSSNNPYEILGLTTDARCTKADIKRAYRSLAMKYHPDVATDKDMASERFAKINAAYRDALERLEQGRGETTSSGSTSWEPPHRRSGAYRSSQQTTSSSSSSPYASTDWRDYMPKRDDEEIYDTNGDSFEKIFSDLFAQGATGSVSFVSDFLDFFESNFDGYKPGSTSSTGPDDPELQTILRTGSAPEVKSEMEETELVVRQLTTKLAAIREELEPLRQAQALRYSERMQNQERIDELEAQQKVVDGYVKTAQRRLLELQNRYKELKQRGSSENTWDRAAASERPSSKNTAEDASWKSDGFGTYGRRSSSRRSRTTTTAERPSTNSQSPRSTPASSTTQATSTISSSSIPPHRRRPTSSYREQVENERRLREIKVDEEFEKLKSELGLL